MGTVISIDTARRRRHAHPTRVLRCQRCPALVDGTVLCPVCWEAERALGLALAARRAIADECPRCQRAVSAGDCVAAVNGVVLHELCAVALGLTGEREQEADHGR